MGRQRSISFHTLGCKLNYSESSMLAQQFEAKGYEVRPFDEGADVFVLNTCSVTDFADRKCRKVVRQALRKNPDSQMVVIGCYAQLKPKEIAKIPGVDLVLGAAEKFNLLAIIEELPPDAPSGQIFSSPIREASDFNVAYSVGDRTRSFLKVQDGCDYSCSFCTIPLARGKSRSDSIENIVEKAIEISEQGVKEIVLTGVNIGDFGQRPEHNGGRQERFIDLIRALDKVVGVERFRISSIEPNLCSDEIIELVAQSERFCPHFHMPLQSGNDKQLAQMQRRYKRELYQNRVERVKTLMPHACVGVDVIVGFPGETDEDFKKTCAFIRDLDISYLHVFTYSERENTLASKMDNTIPVHIRRERNEILRLISDRKKRQFCSAHLNTERLVLFEKHKKPGLMSGFTDNYIKVEAPLELELIGETRMVGLENLTAGSIAHISLAPASIT